MSLIFFLEAEIKRREMEEKEKIEAEAKKGKESKMRRLSHFFGNKINPFNKSYPKRSF